MSHAAAAAAAVETYTAGGMHGGGGPVVRIRVPSPNDVLAGRGGCINAHVGNRQFREWVRRRKDAYNSPAASKSRKLCIVEEIIALVTCRGGRFLQRDTSGGGGGTTCSSSSWWIELDRDKVLSKTSQALREGATRIKAERIRKQQQGLSATATRGLNTNNPQGTIPARSTAISAQQAIVAAARQFQEPNQSTTAAVLPQSVPLESQQSAMKQLCSWLREEVEDDGGVIAEAETTKTTTSTRPFRDERTQHNPSDARTAEEKRVAQIQELSSARGPPHTATTTTHRTLVQVPPPLLLPEEDVTPRFFCRFPSSSSIGGGGVCPAGAAHDRSQSLLQVERMLKDLDCNDTKQDNAPDFVNPFENETTTIG